MNKLYLYKNKMRLGQLPFIGVMFGLLFFLLPCMGNLRIQFHWMCRRLSRSLSTVAAMEKYQSYPVKPLYGHSGHNGTII